MKRSEDFPAVNSTEQLRYGLENPSKTSSTSDYLIASNVNINALHGGQRPIQTQPTSCSVLTSHTTTSTNPGTRDPYSYSSCDWDFPVNSAFNDPLDQKLALSNVLTSTPDPPSPSLESAPFCGAAGSVRNSSRTDKQHA